MAQLVSLLFIAVFIGLFDPHAAQACSGLECFPGTFFPRAGSVPANLKGIYWWPSFSWDEDGGTEGKEDLVRLARVDGDAPEPIGLTFHPIADTLASRAGFLIVPETPFVAGARYVAWDPGCHPTFGTDTPPEPPPEETDPTYPFLSDFEWSVARFSVVDAAPLPETLGELSLSAQRQGEVWAPDDAACTSPLEVIYRDVELELSEDARAWADALFYETRVDRLPYAPLGGTQIDPAPGTALAGRATDRVYAVCDRTLGGGAEGISPGTHPVEMHAHVPGEVTQLASNAESMLLRCPSPTDRDAAVNDGDAGASDASTADASTADASTAADASTLPDAALNDDEHGERTPASDGCSCRAARGGEGNALAILAALFVLARSRARVSRSRRSS